MSDIRVQQARSALQADPTQAQLWVGYVQALIDAGQLAEADKTIGVAARKGLAEPVLHDLAHRRAQALQQPVPSIGTAPSAAPHAAVPSQQEINQLAALFQAQRLAELVPLAQRMTTDYPGFAFGWSVLGATLTALNRHAQALQPAQIAAQLMPREAQVHYNLGKTLNELQRYAEAETSLRLALQIDARLAPAHYQLGLSLHAQGHLIEAERSYRAVLFLDPTDAKAHNNLGITLNAAHRDREAERCFRSAIALDQQFFEAIYNLAGSLHQQRRLAESAAAYQRAIELNPFHAAAHNNLGTVLADQKTLRLAESHYRQALELRPDYAEAYNNLGLCLHQLHRLSEAQTLFVRALELRPHYSQAFGNLGNLLIEMSQLKDAEHAHRQALRIDPGSAVNHYNLGNSLKEQQMSIEAAQLYDRAIEINSDFCDAINNLGNVLHEGGRLDEAITCYQRAIEIERTRQDAHTNLLFVLNYHPDQPPEEIYTAYQAYEQQFGLPLRTQWAPHANAPLASGGASSAPRRLRIGYVSPDLRQHSVRHFLEPLLACHDRLRFEVFAYAELAREDAVTERYRSCCDHFILTRGMSDEELASRIRADAIDVLVDVAGHTAGNRLLVFARKPAPVSLSWLGYGYTTGLKAIDYLLTDEASAPAGSEHLFSEAPWRLPGTAYVYRPDPAMGQLSALPALANGFLTFGTLTRAIRINHRTVRVWAEILQRVPGSRLVIDSKNFQHASMQEAMAERFAQHGIARERLLIGCHSPPWDTLRSIDIGLDCFPHNSGTTLFETLFMGVPYVTLAGRPSVGRLGKSILSGLGKPEWLNAWCATSEQEYIDKAIALASDLTALARIRTELRPQMQRSALMDEAGFARRVEHAYAQMFERWQAQQGPQARHAPPQEARA